MCVVGMSNVVSLTGGSESVQRIITIELSGQQRLPVVTTRRIAEQVRTIWHGHGVQIDGLEGPPSSRVMLYAELSNEGQIAEGLDPFRAWCLSTGRQSHHDLGSRGAWHRHRRCADAGVPQLV